MLHFGALLVRFGGRHVCAISRCAVCCVAFCRVFLLLLFLPRSLSYLPLCRQVDFRHRCRHVLRRCSYLRCRRGSVSNVAARRKELKVWNPVDIKKFKTLFYLPRSSDERFAITQTSSPTFSVVPTATCTPTRTVPRSMTSILTRSLT